MAAKAAIQLILDTLNLKEEFQTRDNAGNVTGATIQTHDVTAKHFPEDVQAIIKAVIEAGGRVVFYPVGTYGLPPLENYQAILE